MKKSVLGAIAICSVATMWGFDGTFLTPRLFNLDVAFVVFMLHLIPFLIMNLFLFKEYKHISTMTKNDLLYFTLVAVFGGVLGTLSIVKALFLVNFHQLSVVLLLQKLQPVFAILLAYVLLKEKLKKHFFLWAGLAIVAGYFLSFGFNTPSLATGGDNVLASLYALLAAFSYGSSTVFGKKIVKKYDFQTAAFYRFGMTAVIMFVYVLITGKMAFDQITNQNWVIFGTIALLVGIGSSFLYYYGLKRVKASKATIFELCFPISAVIFDYVFNGTVLSPVQWIAAIVMLASIVRLSKSE